MQTLSYTISPQILSNLKESETLRKEILSLPLTEEQEILFRYSARIERVFFLLKKDYPETTRSFVEKELAKGEKKKVLKLRLGQNIQEDLTIYDAFIGVLQKKWSVNPNPLSADDIFSLVTTHLQLRPRLKPKLLDELLDYLQAQQDNPILQSAIAQSRIARLQLFTSHNEPISHLISYLFLTKNGYDLRRMMSIEKQFTLYPGGFFHAYQQAFTEDNQTPWLEHYSAAFVKGLTDLLGQIHFIRHLSGWSDPIPENSLSPKNNLYASKSIRKLTSRQKSILRLLELPEHNITNTTVQQAFGISQITASRDLARLRALGLIFSHGNGRSIYYTKV